MRSLAFFEKDRDTVNGPFVGVTGTNETRIDGPFDRSSDGFPDGLLGGVKDRMLIGGGTLNSQFVGVTDGLLVGGINGLFDMSSDGFTDGLLVSVTDGLLVGWIDGPFDGSGDGLTDGVLVGITDGLLLGVTDGLVVGGDTLDGSLVGVKDGLLVGWID